MDPKHHTFQFVVLQDFTWLKKNTIHSTGKCLREIQPLATAEVPMWQELMKINQNAVVLAFKTIDILSQNNTFWRG